MWFRKDESSFRYGAFIRLFMGGMLWALLKVLILHPGVILKGNLPLVFKRLVKGKVPWRRARRDNPSPTYYVGITQEEIDAVTEEDIRRATYKDNMLKPTPGFSVNSRPIVALAKKLGAFDESVSRPEYAQRVFNFVKDEIAPEYGVYQESLEVLRSGGGACVDQAPLVTTLCRAGGVPARAGIIHGRVTDPMIDAVSQTGDPLFAQVFKLFGVFGGVHGSVQVWLDGEWVTSDPTFGDGLCAGLGYQLTDLGRDLDEAGLMSDKPDILTHYTKANLALKLGMLSMGLFIPASVERMNQKMAELTVQGNEIIEAAGGREKYVEMMKKKMAVTDYKPQLPTLEEIAEFRQKKKAAPTA